MKASDIIANALDEFNVEDFVQPDFADKAASEILIALYRDGFRVLKEEQVVVAGQGAQVRK
jgi:hypothetical protein